MSIPNFIGRVSNPFDDLDNIKSIVQAFGEGSFYSRVVRINSKDKVSNIIDRNAEDEFYATTFNKWKENVVSMRKEEVEELKQKGKLKNNFIRVREFLKKTPKAKTKQEVFDILYGKKDSELLDALEDYNPFDQVHTSWNYLASRYFDNKKSSEFDVKHRLYLNVDSTIVHKFATILFNKCNEYGINYEFKFSDVADKADSIVIYCSNDNLLVFVKLLELIKKEYPEFEDKIHKPPVFTGVYDGWIGYGEEYSKAKSSYTSDRCDIVEERLMGHFNNWRSKAGDLIVLLNGENVSIDQYVVHRIAEEFFKEQRSVHNYRVENNSKQPHGNIKLLDKKKYVDRVYKALNTFISRNRGKIYSLDELSGDFCEVPNIFGKTDRIYTSRIKKVLKEVFATNVKKNDKALEFIREDIKTEFRNRDISDRVVISNTTLNQVVNYQKKHLSGHKVIASRKADNKKLYKSILGLFDEMSYIIEATTDLKTLDATLEPYMDKCDALENALDKVKIYGFSGSSIDEDERAQYYICMMHRSIDQLNLKAYKYYRNLTLAYDELLDGAKKL